MRYVIVNEMSNVPIRAIGFCSCYDNKEEAEEAVKNWNSAPKWMNSCKVKIKEVV